MNTSIFDQGAFAPCPKPFNLAEYVLSAGQQTPDKVALAVLSASGAERWSYSKLTRSVRGLATGFVQRGLQPGDRILMRLGNSVAFPITYLAAISVGLIPVPTSAMLTEREVSKLADEVLPRLIVADPGVALPGGDVPVLGSDRLPSLFQLPPAPFQMGDPQRPAYIVFTSGTSGVPRAVTHAHRAIWARRMMWNGWYGLTPQDRLLHAGAFNWTYTLGTGLLDPWTIGATALIPSAEIGPAQLALLLKRHDATIFAAAPGVYRQMLRAPFQTMPKLRHGLSAGEKLPSVTRARWEAATGTSVHEAFGMSECSTFVSGSPGAPATNASLGRPQVGRRVAILDPKPVSFGKPGILAVSTKDPGLMLGYWNAKHQAPDPLQGDWFETGDIMQMSSDGALTYLGRNDDMMNAGGFRVSPLEVEAAMSTHPAITECAAVEERITDDTTIITLYYAAAQPLDVESLKQFASKHLARYKCPREFRFVTELPRGGNGKLLRKALRSTKDHKK